MNNKTRISSVVIILSAGIAVYYMQYQSSHVSSINDFSEEPTWSFKLPESIITTPILIDKKIIFRSEDKVYSLNSKNGEVVWEISSKAFGQTSDSYAIEKTLLGNSRYLVAGERHNSLGIYSTKTGEQIWNIGTQINFISDVDIVGDILIVATHDESLVAYDLSTKMKLWEVGVPNRSGLAVAINSSLVVLSAGNALRTFDIKSGSLLNERSFDTSTTGDVILDDKTVFLAYAGSGNWYITSLPVDALDENWTFYAGDITHPYLSTTNNQLYAFNKSLFSIDKITGTLLWEEDSQDLYSAPAFYKDNLYFISAHGKFERVICIAELELGQGENCWRIEKVGQFSNLKGHIIPPLVADDLLIISTNSNIAAYSLP